METTVIKIGNSQGVRLSRRYMNKLGVKIGDKVDLVIKKQKPNTAKAVAALEAIAGMNGTLANIEVEKWQAERNAQWTERDRQLRDIAGR